MSWLAGFLFFSFLLNRVAMWARVVTACCDHAIFIPMQTQYSIQPRDGKASVVSFHDHGNILWVSSGDFSANMSWMFFCLVKGVAEEGLNVRTRWDEHWRQRKSLSQCRNPVIVTRDASTICCLKGRSLFSIAIILCTSIFLCFWHWWRDKLKADLNMQTRISEHYWNICCHVISVIPFVSFIFKRLFSMWIFTVDYF